MRCPECGQESPGASKFCGSCGARLPAACPACGAASRPSQKFCGECGANLAHAGGHGAGVGPKSYTPTHLAEKILTSRTALEGERKQVTVLFADLKGSMELLADRDPEEARRLLDPVLEHMMDAVHYYEGTVNQVMGDGIMALFGAPLAHEDHAVRGCYAALKMQESVKRYSEQVGGAAGVPIQIRVGLNAGEVVVRSIGNDLHMDYTAVGQTTHLAARMEQMAAPGSILIPASVLHLTRDAVMVKPLGPRTVKGLAASVDVFELVGAGTIQSRRQAAAARDLTRFVGREGESRVLREALARAGAGRGQVVGIAAEPGVGKSRLVREFIHSSITPGWRVLETGGIPSGKATAYLPLAELLRLYFQIDPRDAVAVIRGRILDRLRARGESPWPALFALLQILDVPIDDVQWDSLTPAQRREHMLEAPRRLLIRESDVQPLLVIFDDLHWMDSETQAFLDGLVESLPKARILVLATYRLEHQHGWGNRSQYTALRLDPLPVDSAEELLEQLLGSNPDLRPLKQWLIGRTEGNPFFLEESVRTLIETGAVAGDPGAYRLLKPVESIQLPATIQAVLAPRIDRLPAEAKRLLQAAAVIGKDVPLALLEAIAEMPEDVVRRSLSLLQAGEFVYEISLFPAMEYTFRHALTHEVAYGSLLRERRRTLHARVVEAIEQLHADRLAEQVERLAHHALRGEVWQKAVGYLRQAGAKAAARSANREAVQLFEQALAALQHLPEGRETTAHAIDLRLDLRPPLLQMGQLERALALSQEAEIMAQKLGDEPRLARVYTYLINYHYLKGEPDLAIDYGERCLRLGHAAQDPALQALARGYLGYSHHAQGQYGQAESALRQNVEALEGSAASSTQSRISFVSSSGWLAFVYAERGEFGLAAGCLDKALRAAAASGHPYAEAIAGTLAGLVWLWRGQPEEALPLLEKSLEVCREKSLDVWRPIPSSLLGLTRVLLGRVDEGLRLLDEAVQRSESLGVRAYLALWTTLLGEGLLRAGQLEQARTVAERAVELARLHRERGHHARALRLRGDVLVQADPADLDVAEACYGQALALAGELGMRPLLGHIHLSLGRLHRQAGRHEAAAEHLSTAFSLLRELGLWLWVGSAADELTALGRLLVVSRSNVQLYDELTQHFAGRPVAVILDRRQGERRQSAEAAAVERRRADRRRDTLVAEALRTFGFAIIPRVPQAA